MILVFELSWKGTTHAPGNAATTQIVARAFPGQEVRIHADPSHVEQLRRDSALTALPNVTFAPISIPEMHYGKPAVVCPRRLRQEFGILLRALRAAPKGEPHLIFLISTNATTAFAAAWAARLSGRRAAVQVGFHGNLNDAFGYRPRNPLWRALDTRSSLTARYPVPLRFLVLEEGIRDALGERLPGAQARTDALPLPINTAEATEPPAVLQKPLRFGFVGLGTADKGMDVFLRVARRIRARHGAEAEFVHVGAMPRNAPAEGADVLAHPPSAAQLPREAFTARIRSLHYVVLPFRRGYYDLSASGALIDAITWLRPVIATRVPLSAQAFATMGAIGALCEDEAGLEAAIEQALHDPDPARYARQVEALRQARAARDPAALAATYRRIVSEGFPGLLPG
jgi:glycosyltransferase involved in cell wall biosynthesis